ncbi:MAG: GDSL-type esterase/lipase family protein, partial [Myxococcaceae bacterium]
VFTLASNPPDGLGLQVGARRPDVFVFFFGTNESLLPALDPQAMRARYGEVLRTLRQASPESDCLLIGPTDRMEQAAAGGWRQAPSQAKVIAGLREVARAERCAFWSARAAMGGPGSIALWVERKPALALPDHVHLTPRGYEVLADALLDDLLAAYEAH